MSAQPAQVIFIEKLYFIRYLSNFPIFIFKASFTVSEKKEVN